MQERCFSQTLNLVAITDTKKTSTAQKNFMPSFAKVALLRKEVASRKNTQFRKEAAGRIKCVGWIWPAGRRLPTPGLKYFLHLNAAYFVFSS